MLTQKIMLPVARLPSCKDVIFLMYLGLKKVFITCIGSDSPTLIPWAREPPVVKGNMANLKANIYQFSPRPQRKSHMANSMIR